MIRAVRLAAMLAGFTISLAASGAASADPTTYAGKLGNSDIVVELTGDPSTDKGPIAGRYFYRAKGVDIPLQAKATKAGKLELAEEGECDDTKCGEGAKAPISAQWFLSASNDGKTLKGTWKGKKSFGIELSRVGSRPKVGDYPETPYGLYSASEELFLYNEAPITMETSPYDFLRLDMAETPGEKQGWPGASYRSVTDPRTKFPMPRIVALSDGVSFDAANAFLKNRHWQKSRSALACVSLQYAGFHEDGIIQGPGGGDLGGFDETSADVTALTDSLISWRESGSIFCGGAHPENYSNSYTLDIAQGTLLGFEDMIANTVDGKAGAELVAFVKAQRPKPTAQTDIDFETECGMDDLIGEYLAARVNRDDDKLSLVFGLEHMPHAIVACGQDDLLTLPVAEAKPFLTPRFASLLGLN
jgi:hypothetical protein